MIVEGAIINEQGVTFGIIIVKSHVISINSKAQAMRSDIQSSLKKFSNIPLILASQDSRGQFTYQGKHDIVDFLANISADCIPWMKYTY